MKQSALIQLSPLSKRLVYTYTKKLCYFFNSTFFTFCVNPYFYHYMFFIFSLHLRNGRTGSLGSILSHWRQDLFNGGSTPFHLKLKSRQGRPAAQYHVLCTFKKYDISLLHVKTFNEYCPIFC